ncbi:MAG: S8 family serine peptidase, partial [Candidatus Dormibacteraeota bacterium]|nr:S8 family serine peptidase [Candidatus Dormibacteraeota bacterium]
VQHKSDNGMNIRVLNLSFGTDSQLPYTSDPLAIAAEAAWHRGIFVTASAGNDGLKAHPYGLADPAYDPTIMAVGASESVGDQVGQDVVPGFSSAAVNSRGRRPNVVAPGSHLQSLRVPGSYVDRTYGTTGGITPRFFRGSGTSQAAAAVSGAAALVLSEHPGATPDQVRGLLTATSTHLAGISTNAQGSGVINLDAALVAALPAAGQVEAGLPAQGAAKDHSGADREKGHDAAGKDLPSHSVPAGSSWSGSSWSGGSWLGSSWSGSSWSGGTWSGSSWSGSSWSGSSWSGSSWSGSSWSGSSWSGSSWSGSSWSDALWSAADWS